MTKQNKIRIVSLLVLMSVFAIAASFFVDWKVSIQDYNAATDKDEIVALYEKDKYWLTDSPASTIEFILKYKTPDANPFNRGKLAIQVLKEKNNFAGFTAYYMTSSTVGKILFLAVKHEFRGKQYGQRLMKHAIKRLKNMGAQEIVLVTRTTNFPAQKVYTALGFQETGRDQELGYLFYRYTL